MHDIDDPLLMAELNEWMGALTDEQWKAFCYCNIAAKTDAAVNSLMQRFRDRNGSARVTGVGQLVITTVYYRCGSKVAEAVSLAASATCNPSLHGWALELKQLAIIKSAVISATNTGYVMTDALKSINVLKSGAGLFLA